jgi:hypothetical protein
MYDYYESLHTLKEMQVITKDTLSEVKKISIEIMVYKMVLESLSNDFLNDLSYEHLS